MKHTTRKLLSLLMALVMVLSLVPVAMAEITVQVSPDTLSLKVNEKSTLTASMTPNSDNTSATWTSSDTAVATVNENTGEVTAIAVGSATITAKFGTNNDAPTGTCALTVTAADKAVTNVTIKNSSNLTVVAGNNITLEAEVTPNDATNKTVKWSSGDTNIATVGETSGVVTGKTAGKVTITATAEGGTNVKATCEVTVTAAPATVAVTGVTLNKTTADMTVGDTETLTATVTVTPNEDANKAVTWSTSDASVATVSGGKVTAKGAGTATITATSEKNPEKKATCTVTVTALPKGSIDLDYKSMSIGEYITATPEAPSGVTFSTIDWSASPTGSVKIEARSNSESVYVTGLKSGKVTLTATFKNASGTTVAVATSDEITISSYSVNFTVYGYVGNDTEKYYLSEITDQYGDSIFDQIDEKIQSKKGYSNYYTKNIYFLTDTDTIGDLYSTNKYENTYFQLDKANPTTKKAEFILEVTATNGSSRDDEDFYVELVLTVDDGTSASSGDISYTGAIGDDVYFDAADFEDFYYDKTNGGTLKYVSFDTVSGGVLYCDDGKVGTKDCYVDPTTKQIGLDEVYFSPTGTTAKQAKTVTIGFTAYGSKSSQPSKAGTVTITYLNGEAKDITYSLKSDGTVALDPADFTAAYKEVTNKTAPTGMTIVFQNVPSYGDLTYADSSKTKPKDITLTSRNIKSYNFTTKTGKVSNKLEDVTYSGSSSRSDTIDYIAYSGGTALFTGKVVFNGKKEVPTNLAVPFTCFGSAGTYFNSASFTAANTSAMSSAAYIRFGVPAHGTLTYGGATGTGTNIYVATLGSVLYQPNAGFNGTDTVIFAAYDASGNSVASGQVNIVVSGNTATTNTPGGSSGTGATSVDQFTDVPKTNGTAWYRDKLANLVSKGIMNGKGDGKFDPTGKVKNGEALKMILLAAGYPAQATPSGNDWAINYKNLAVSNNLISSSVVLNDDISRDAVAELAAKALGLTPVTSGQSPFVDSSNGYAIALYNAGIINGDTSSGSRKFLGSDTLQRAEICVIIYAMNEYVANRYASTKPDGI